MRNLCMLYMYVIIIRIHYIITYKYEYKHTDVKPYPALQLTQSDVEQLDKIYSLYKNYKEFQESMSSMLWGDLDITALQKVEINMKICKNLYMGICKDIKIVYV